MIIPWPRWSDEDFQINSRGVSVSWRRNLFQNPPPSPPESCGNNNNNYNNNCIQSNCVRMLPGCCSWAGATWPCSKCVDSKAPGGDHWGPSTPAPHRSPEHKPGPESGWSSPALLTHPLGQVELVSPVETKDGVKVPGRSVEVVLPLLKGIGIAELL